MGTGASTAKPVQHRVYVSATVSIQTDPWPPEGAVVATQVFDNSATPKKTRTIEDTWMAVCETLDVALGEKKPDPDPIKRTGWKTIRIFVSSTFKDLHHEREILVKEVFPDLRAWCESRRLHLVECDLRWGIPKDTTTEVTLRTCLGEIDRCYADNNMPFFLNMTSERIGWIPVAGEVPEILVNEYKWIFGLSITEMEIVHGAYRKDNPNSLFLIRDNSFLDTVPDEHRGIFRDENDIAPEKLKVLKQMIKDRFPPSRVVSYTGTYESKDSASGKIHLKLSENFRDSVFKFFKERISLQYPLLQEDDDPYRKARESHEAFLASRAVSVLGRTDILKQVTDYVDGAGHDTPMLILGGPGTGKSSILSKAADETINRATCKEIPGAGDKSWHVFYHFVGAVPGSTELHTLLMRLLIEVDVINESNMPSDLDAAVQMSCSVLNNPSTKPVIIFVDALNQLDDDQQAQLMTWVPRKLAPQVRCIFTMINDTPQHKNLMARESKPSEIFVKPLSLSVRKDMIAEYLGKFNKKLDMDQMINLLSKKCSENPLWLSIACEELRVSGDFRNLLDKVNHLADDLLELLQQILSRFEQEGGGYLLVATLCLLEVSNTGLLESELLTILADKDHLMPPEATAEKGEKEKSEKEKFKPGGNLPAYEWAGVYRALRPFLRPFGDSGEGRLDFYHRSLSKAVRKKYLKSAGEEGLNAQHKWWHTKLASYFHYSDNYDRKVEELPFHLLKLQDSQRLERFLGEWPTFDRLYDQELSVKLLRYWRECGGSDAMMECYSEKLQVLKEDPRTTQDLLAKRYEQVSRVLIQGGLHEQSLSLATTAMEMEEKELGNRPKRLVELYGLMAVIWDQKTKLFEFCAPEQIPDQKQTIIYNKKTIELLNQGTLTGRYYKHMLGRQYIKLGFSLAALADCGGDPVECPVQQCLTDGNSFVDKAIEIFKQLHDNGNIAEAIMTKAVLCRGDKALQIKHYTEALELCKQAYGHYHQLTGRIYMNTGIYYEDNRDYHKAYEFFKHYTEALELCKQAYGHYHHLTGRIYMNTGIYYEDNRDYHKAYDFFNTNHLINLEVYGPDHIRTLRSKNVLMEETYTWVRRARESEVASTDD